MTPPIYRFDKSDEATASLTPGDRTKVVNQMHGFLLEFGISLPQGLAIMKRLSSVLAEHELPVRLTMLQRLHDHFVYLDGQIKELAKSWPANWLTMIWAVVC